MRARVSSFTFIPVFPEPYGERALRFMQAGRNADSRLPANFLLPPATGVDLLSTGGDRSSELDRWWELQGGYETLPVFIMRHDERLPELIPGLDAEFVIAVSDDDELLEYQALPNVNAIVADSPQVLLEYAMQTYATEGADFFRTDFEGYHGWYADAEPGAADPHARATARVIDAFLSEGDILPRVALDDEPAGPAPGAASDARPGYEPPPSGRRVPPRGPDPARGQADDPEDLMPVQRVRRPRPSTTPLPDAAPPDVGDEFMPAAGPRRRLVASSPAADDLDDLFSDLMPAARQQRQPPAAGSASAVDAEVDLVAPPRRATPRPGREPMERPGASGGPPPRPHPTPEPGPSPDQPDRSDPSEVATDTDFFERLPSAQPLAGPELRSTGPPPPADPAEQGAVAPPAAAPPPSLLSPDGRHRWDGTAWVQVDPPAETAAVSDAAGGQRDRQMPWSALRDMLTRQGIRRPRPSGRDLDQLAQDIMRIVQSPQGTRRPIAVVFVGGKGGTGNTTNASAFAAFTGAGLDPYHRSVGLIEANAVNPDLPWVADPDHKIPTVFELVGRLNQGQPLPAPTFALSDPGVAVYPEMDGATEAYTEPQLAALRLQLGHRHDVLVVDCSKQMPDLSTPIGVTISGWINLADVVVIGAESHEFALNAAIRFLQTDSLRNRRCVVTYLSSPKTSRHRLVTTLTESIESLPNVQAVTPIPWTEEVMLAQLNRQSISQVRSRLASAYVAMARAIIDAVDPYRA